MQAKSFLRNEVFQQYDCKESENIQFQVNMTVLLDCLSIFGLSTNTSLQLKFPASQDKLILMYDTEVVKFNVVRLEEGGVVTDCALTINDPEDSVKYNFRSVECNKVVLEVGVECFFSEPSSTF